MTAGRESSRQWKTFFQLDVGFRGEKTNGYRCFSAGEQAAGEVRAEFSEHGAEDDQDGDDGDGNREEQRQGDERFQRDPGIAEFLYDRQEFFMQHIDEERI